MRFQSSTDAREQQLSFLETLSFEPCSSPLSLSGKLIAEFDLVGYGVPSNHQSPKPVCPLLNPLLIGGEPGSWTRLNQTGSRPVWEPDDCVYPDVKKTEVADFLKRKRVLIWEDSVSRVFWRIMSATSSIQPGAVSYVSSISQGDGLGLSVLFKYTSLDLGEHWESLRNKSQFHDLIVLNSGIHDLAPNRVKDSNGKNCWVGSKPRAIAAYRERLEVLFRAIASDDSKGPDGTLLKNRLLWRSTTHAHLFAGNVKAAKSSLSLWHQECRTQQLSVPRVARINAIAKELAHRYGITFWDVSPLSLAAPGELASDLVHPTGVVVRMWSTILFHARGMANLP